MYTNYNRYKPVFTFEQGVVTISGSSVLEDPTEIWLKFIEALKKYIAVWDEVTVDFCMEAFNTSSSMYVTNVIKVLNETALTKKVTINWYYLEIDEDMEFIGEEFRDMSKVKVNLIKR